MDTHQRKPSIDPLHRIFVPVEKRMTDGRKIFQTSDGDEYVRGLDGSIRLRAIKINGKAARKARQAARKINVVERRT